jgi:hypothetical protein
MAPKAKRTERYAYAEANGVDRDAVDKNIRQIVTQTKDADSLSRTAPLAEFSPMQQQQIRGPKEVMMDGTEPIDTREDILPPPEIATRTRCYKLNLNVFCPFDKVAPPLTDPTENYTPLQVAINTARIFRDIKVGKDGTIKSQKARATRRSRASTKNKFGEKSRQATKIDKAKDLVEETILTGKAPDSEDPAKIQSIVVMGDYDDMKSLVRDGAKKLREASESADDSLLNINRGRDEP